MVHIAAMVATMVLLAALPTSGASEPGSIPFTVDRNGAVVVPVLIDGHGPFRFMVDTGSNASFVTPEVVDRLSAPLVAHADIITAAGHELRAVAELRGVTLGAVTAERLLPSVVPRAVLTSLAGELDGVLGQDFLKPHTYTLDYQRKVFRWDAGAGAGRARVPLIERNDRFLMELRQLDGRMLRLVPDTGSEGLVLFTRGGQLPAPIKVSAERLRLDTLVATRDVQVGIVRRLHVGPLVLTNQSAAIVARDAPDAPDGDGLLPLHRFRTVTFHADERVILIQP